MWVALPIRYWLAGCMRRMRAVCLKDACSLRVCKLNANNTLCMQTLRQYNDLPVAYLRLFSPPPSELVCRLQTHSSLQDACKLTGSLQDACKLTAACRMRANSRQLTGRTQPHGSLQEIPTACIPERCTQTRRLLTGCMQTHARATKLKHTIQRTIQV